MADGEVKVVITDDGSSAQTAAEIGKTTDAIHDLKGDAAEAGDSLEKFTFKGREMHHVIGELNRAIPGLGFAMQGLVTSAGPWIVAILAIQEAMGLWKQMQDDAKASAEALANTLDATRKATHDALVEFTEFNKLMANAPDGAPEYIKKLEDINKQLNAQFEVKKKLLELEGKPTGDLAQQKSAAEIDAIANQRIAIENQRSDLQRQKDALAQTTSGAAAKFKTGQGVNVGFGSSPDEAAGEIIQHGRRHHARGVRPNHSRCRDRDGENK